jgi:Zn-dependent alcohol dehydrogenase
MKIRAAVLNAMGAALPYAQSRPLSIDEVELDPPGHGEVLVRVAAAGLCHSDLSVINGDRPRPVPMALGHEASGVVEELGPRVDDLARGDHVVMVLCQVAGIACRAQGGGWRAGRARTARGRPSARDDQAQGPAINHHSASRRSRST